MNGCAAIPADHTNAAIDFDTAHAPGLEAPDRHADDLLVLVLGHGRPYARNRCRRMAATLPKIRTPSTTTSIESGKPSRQ